MSDEELHALAAEARLHANNLAADLQNATNRVQHIRTTRLQAEAEALAQNLESLAARQDKPRDYDAAHDDRAKAYGIYVSDFPTH